MSAGAPRRSAGGIAGVVLAAGEGRRLRPLTLERPKPLCPVGNRPLLDRAVSSVRAAVAAVAVNVHHGRTAMIEHLDQLEHRDDLDDVDDRGDLDDREAVDARAGARAGDATRGSWLHVSIEVEQALGTAGALGQLRPWLAGRAALIVNADAYAEPDLAAFVAGWDHERVRILVAGREPFGPRSRIVASLMPWSDLKALVPEPSGLYERLWRARAAEGAVETCAYDGPFVDCGSPRSYLEANLLAIGADGRDAIVATDAQVEAGASIVTSVIGARAEVAGEVSSSVIWPGARVVAGERLDRAIRTSRGRTVLVR